jgi:branched-chain amino acid transport system substrate-binding protein
MRRFLGSVLGVALAFVAGTAVADTVKVGVIGAFSGPFTTFGKNFKAGVEAYFAANSNKVGNHTIEVIYRDLDGIAPPKAKALAQELVVKDKVQYLAGVVFTPNALAISEILEEANVPFVIFNAATSAITTKSPYVVRTSFTLAQNSGPMGKVAAEKGFKNVITMVSDYGPGHDAEAAFKKAFEAAGGKVVESVRMPPPTTDFAPFMQRARDSGAQAVFAFLPAGPPTLSFAKAFNNSGMKGKVELLTTGDLTQESDLPALGADGVGILSTFHYSVAHPGKENEAFVAAAQKALGADAGQLTFPAVAAYDEGHCRHDQSDRRQAGCQEGGGGREGHGVGEPARAGEDRPEHAARDAEHLFACRREGGRQIHQQRNRHLSQYARPRPREPVNQPRLLPARSAL